MTTTIREMSDREQHWESILRLPYEPRSADELRVQAEAFVRACRSSMTKTDIAWLKHEIERGRALGAEELAIDPDDAEWLRIEAVLDGALAGLATRRSAVEGHSGQPAARAA